MTAISPGGCNRVPGQFTTLGGHSGGDLLQLVDCVNLFRPLTDLRVSSKNSESERHYDQTKGGKLNHRSGTKYIIEDAEKPFSRLQVDHIDLYQAHVDDENIGLEESLEAFNKLVKQGKVRVLGASNFSAERFSQALPGCGSGRRLLQHVMKM